MYDVHPEPGQALEKDGATAAEALDDFVKRLTTPRVAWLMLPAAKIPGETMRGEEVELLARHQSGDEMEPYERLLGDASLFAREDGVEEAWRVVDPILDNVTPAYPYERNSWGSKEADALVAREGGWHNPQVRTDRTELT